MTLLGVLIAPLRTWRAWTTGRGTSSLFHEDLDYPEILSLTLASLRERLGLPTEGLCREPRALREGAPGLPDAPAEGASPAIPILLQVALLLGGLAAYLLVSDAGSDRDDGYAFVVAIHLAILAAGCLAASVKLATSRRGRPR